MAEPKTNTTVEVRATVILRIPNLDTNELTQLHIDVQKIIDTYGGDFDVSTSKQLPT